MARRKMTALLGAVSLTTALAMATPANAGETEKRCASQVGVKGFTESNGQGTYVTSGSLSNCGKLGLRVNYVHVGGDSWTSWKYSTGGHWSVSSTTKNAVRSAHTTTVGNLYFYSYR